MLSITYWFDGATARTVSIAETATAKQQTAAIQAALDAVAGHAGGHVALSAGTFTLAGTGRASDGALRVGSNTDFSGAGMGATVLKLADGSTAVTGMIRTGSGQTLADGTVTTTHDVVIHDLSLDGNKANTTGNVDGFYCGPRPGTAQSDSAITLDHVEIMNMSRYGFDPHEQTTGLTIQNSVAHHNGVDGFTIDFCSDVTLTNNVAYANGRHGFNIVTGSSNVVMSGNDAHDNGGSGITVQTGDNEVREWTHAVTISGGHVDHNGRDGITVRQATDVAIHDVALDANGGNGIALAGVVHADLAGNTITHVASAGLAIKLAGYTQTFGDSDALNDRYIETSDVTVDGVAQTIASDPQGVPLWTWHVTSGDDTIIGSAGRDAIAAGSGDDTVSGGAGDDTLYGNDGRDTLDGGAGNDILVGGVGDDTLKAGLGLDALDGGAGFDTLDFTKFGQAVYVDLAAGTASTSTAGTSSITTGVADVAVATLVAIEAVKGTSFADTIAGDARDNALDGAGGFDRMSGGGGNDVINGGAGNDVLSGGLGNDVLTGGSGSDVFLFETGWGTDTITDFTRKQDKLDLTGVTGAHTLSDLVVTQSGADAVVAYGGNSIVLTGVAAATLTASDFILH